MSTQKITIVPDEPIGTISPMIHGHFAEHLGRCCYDGLWIGHDSPVSDGNGFHKGVIAALKDLGIPQLRWPGGCFADSYHWRDGIGKRDARPESMAESCGEHVVENNQLGTHEFIALCREIGAEPYLAGNVGSGTVQELSEWVQYCNDTRGTTLSRERAANGHPESMNVKYWGVGNENWGCGGNYEAADYAKEYRRYATFLRQTDRNIELVACGADNQDWNLKLLETLRNHLGLIDHLSVHHYWGGGHTIEFDENEYYQVFRGCNGVENVIRATDDLIQFFTQGKRKIGIAFDEWGIWHPQANVASKFEAASTVRDAVSAAGALDVFQRWAHRVTMANMAQIVNVLQCLVQTEGEKFWLTPTYFAFKLYAAHRGAMSLRTDITDGETKDLPAFPRTFPESTFATGALPLLSASASRNDKGEIIVSVSNRHLTESKEVQIDVRGSRIVAGTLETLTSDAANAVNTADQPNRVGIASSPITVNGDVLILTLPPYSVQTATLTLG